MRERWMPVAGFECLYEVSDRGRVRSAKGVLAPNDNGGGYFQVHLYRSRVRTVVLIHRLVAQHFLPHRKGCHYLNHKDFNRANNAVRNLEWCTQRENVAHLCAAGRHSTRRFAVIGTCVATGKRVRFESQAHAEVALARTGKKSGAVNHCLAGKKRSAYGHTWERA